MGLRRPGNGRALVVFVVAMRLSLTFTVITRNTWGRQKHTTKQTNEAPANNRFGIIIKEKALTKHTQPPVNPCTNVTPDGKVDNKGQARGGFRPHLISLALTRLLLLRATCYVRLRPEETPFSTEQENRCVTQPIAFATRWRGVFSWSRVGETSGSDSLRVHRSEEVIGGGQGVSLACSSLSGSFFAATLGRRLSTRYMRFGGTFSLELRSVITQHMVRLHRFVFLSSFTLFH